MGTGSQPPVPCRRKTLVPNSSNHRPRCADDCGRNALTIRVLREDPGSGGLDLQASGGARDPAAMNGGSGWTGCDTGGHLEIDLLRGHVEQGSIAGHARAVGERNRNTSQRRRQR